MKRRGRGKARGYWGRPLLEEGAGRQRNRKEVWMNAGAVESWHRKWYEGDQGRREVKKVENLVDEPGR